VTTLAPARPAHPDQEGRPPASADRQGRELLAALAPFAHESRARSWWTLLSTLALLSAALFAAAAAPWWPLQLAAGLLAGLLMVRAFVMCHDYLHGAILRGSRTAQWIFGAIGVLVLTPPRSWRHSHNFHHAHVGKIEGSETGSFPIMTTDAWRQATRWQRLIYRVNRHPLTIVLAYWTVFVFSVCLLSLFANPRRFWDSALALGVHAGVVAALWTQCGPAVVAFAYWVPLLFAAAVGAYLFYAQHNFEGVRILPAGQWNFVQASLVSCSFLRLGPVMRYFTANISYHHVHHLNPLVPWYRLPEAMAAIPELQRPGTTSLAPRDVRACLRLKLWDERGQRMVGWREARALAAAG
jgi:omega-6 fatty acid desaturase (delta-12 desaturase)